MKIKFENPQPKIVTIFLEDVNLNMIVTPTELLGDKYLFGVHEEYDNLAEDFLDQILATPDDFTEDRDFYICDYTGGNQQVILRFTAHDGKTLTLIYPETKKAVRYPITFQEFKTSFIEYMKTSGEKYNCFTSVSERLQNAGL